MAIKIADIPVLTDDVAETFENNARACEYVAFHRTPEQEEAMKTHYNDGMRMVESILSKAII